MEAAMTQLIKQKGVARILNIFLVRPNMNIQFIQLKRTNIWTFVRLSLAPNAFSNWYHDSTSRL